MHHRLSLWMAFFAFAFVAVLRAQTPAPAAQTARPAMQPGQIMAKQVTGEVTVSVNGVTTPLNNDALVSQSSTVITAKESSAVLVFSNGATAQIGPESILVIEEFMQDPFSGGAKEIKPAELTEEPTTSRTRLHLTKGELIGKVAKLKHAQGSSFTVQTPVGAAGIRGTTFRIVFRPSGTGQAFAVFSLSTVEGNVLFQQGAPGRGQSPAGPSGQGQPQGGPSGQGAGPGEPQQGPADSQSQGTTQAQSQAQGQTQSQSPGQAQGGPSQPQGQAVGQGGGSPAGVPVVGGQEVVVTISVDVNPRTGQVTITTPPAVVSTQPIAIETQALIVRQAETLVTAAAQTTFTSTPPPTPTQGDASGQGQQQSSEQQSSEEPQQQSQQGEGNSGTTPNSGTGTDNSTNGGSQSPSGTTTPSQSSNPPTPVQQPLETPPPTQTPAPASPPAPTLPTPPPPPVVPPVTQPPMVLTPGAGK